MLPTGSRIHRAMACVASAVLPGTDSVSEAALRGTSAHLFLELVRKNGREKALEGVPAEYRELCEAIDVDRLTAMGLFDAEYVSELALAYDVETEATRVIGKSQDRDYGQIAPTEIAMSLDVAAALKDGECVYVGDYKTGRGDVPPARLNWQLMVGALALARLHGRSNAIVSIIRIPENGRPWFDTYEYDAFHLAEIATDLRVLAKRITGEREYVASGFKSRAYPLRAVTGPHCKYCPSLQFCPAQTTLIRRMAMEPEAVGQEIRDLLTPNTAAKAWETLKTYDAVAKRVRAALYDYAGQAPFVLPNGNIVGPVESQREEIVGRTAYEVLTQLHGEKVAMAACELDASKASVERALKTISANGTLASRKREALDAIREAGGIKMKVSKPTIKEHGPKGEGPELTETNDF